MNQMNQKTEDELKTIFKLKPLVDEGVPDNVFHSKYRGFFCFFQSSQMSQNETDKWEWSVSKNDTTLANGVGVSMVDVLRQCHTWCEN